MSASRTLDVHDSPVHLLDLGDGPAVLLLHGSGPGTTGSGAWLATADAHAGTHRVIAPDQAGFGRTPLPPGSNGGLRTWTDQAAALMEALGIDTYAVVGHSMGGAVAMSLAATRPAHVTAVVGVSSMGAPGAPLSEDLDALWGAEPGTAGARDMLSRLFHDQSLVTASAVAARAEAMEAGAASYDVLFPPPRERWSDDLTLSPATVEAVIAPVLLVHGAQDRVTPLRTAALPLLDLLPDVRLHVLGRCGHAPFVEHPAEFRQVVAEFLARTAR
ncbi:alpha/beta hydrolase [Nocardioides KLBMP 9356]|uniref:Alpha/beta hydrolase n=1 Tax=Nocardioides potassii TaxID=2911371 RepID=A0ABS9H958_9ACTN|nr:alpha/beta hydrolase [Nocardioides potassii]MCF6376858.1 alpha/beta hydrolase [Nocardioides potassii]